jgi:transposase
LICPNCQQDIAYKNGRTKKGVQRYYCDSCQKTFQMRPFPVESKSSLTTEQMQELRENGQTLQQIGEAAGLSREAVRQRLVTLSNPQGLPHV